MTITSSGLTTIHLPPVVREGGELLCAALEKRRTIREIDSTPITRQQLAKLLWAAFGVNRRTGPFGLAGRTAASASNSQEIDLYVVLENGAYLYDAPNTLLAPVVAGDLRAGALTLGQPQTVGDVLAPIQLIYVVDLDLLIHSAGFQEPGLQDPDVQSSYAFVDTGLIAQNVYLFCAANRLAAWLHNCDRASLARRLKLRAQQRVLFAQSVGYCKQA
jgi:nitroreductase